MRTGESDGAVAAFCRRCVGGESRKPFCVALPVNNGYLRPFTATADETLALLSLYALRSQASALLCWDDLRHAYVDAHPPAL